MSIEYTTSDNELLNLGDSFLLTDSSHFIPFDSRYDSCDAFISKLSGIEYMLKQNFLDLPKIADAYYFAYDAHGEQKRKSGEPYIMHPVSVAIILTKLKQDTSTIIAALLHDVIEDTPYEYDNIKEIFGEDVASIVDGVTKVTGVEKDARKEQYEADTYRKIILAASKNPRTIMVKLADRLHNLLTLESLAPDRQKRMADETLDIFAPIAAEMGVYTLKIKLEDLSMKYAHAEEYKIICQKTDVENEKNSEIINEFRNKVNNILIENTVRDFQIFGRIKSIYSIYRKHIDREVPYDEIYDILGFRIVCREELDCYKIMGLLHKIWQPIGDKIKDYIAIPKENGYKSLHTTLIYDGQHIEVQIRTWAMNLEAEYGFAAHNDYKGNGKTSKFLEKFVVWEKEIPDSSEFVNLLKGGVSVNEITVYMRKGGKIVKLPDGAVVLDLAYYLGESKGNKCSGAIVEGKFVPIDRRLHNNETVTLLTSTDAKPSIDWLAAVKTPMAKLAIKKRLRQMEADDKANRAFSLLISAHEYVNKPITFDEYKAEILKYFGLTKEKELFDSIYSGQITTDDILKFTQTQTNEVDLKKFTNFIVGKKKHHNLLIESLKYSEQIRPALCCSPLPGDRIVGFRTAGDRGISIHRENCENAFIFADDLDKVIYCEWADNTDFGEFSEEITILGVDKEDFVIDVMDMFINKKIKTKGLNYKKENGVVKAHICVKVKTASELDEYINLVKKIKDTRSAFRSMPPQFII